VNCFSSPSVVTTRVLHHVAVGGAHELADDHGRRYRSAACGPA
jgi:hypothetical protein